MLSVVIIVSWLIINFSSLISEADETATILFNTGVESVRVLFVPEPVMFPLKSNSDVLISRLSASIIVFPITVSCVVAGAVEEFAILFLKVTVLLAGVAV